MSAVFEFPLASETLTTDEVMGLRRQKRLPHQPRHHLQRQPMAEDEGAENGQDGEDQDPHGSRSAMAASTSAQVICIRAGPSRQRIPAKDLRTHRHKRAALAIASAPVVACGMG